VLYSLQLQTNDGGDSLDTMKKPAYTYTEQEIVQLFKTDDKQGLTTQEAERRLHEYGPNSIESGSTVSPWKILLHNLNNIIVYLLMAASAVAFAMGDTVEGVAIIVAILIAVLSGFVSEFKAQKSVEALQNMVKTVAKVLRDGNIQEMASHKLVPGDLVFIEEGDSITMDGRIIRSSNFAVNESALTGESEPIEKQTDTIDDSSPIGDRKNMVHGGTAATRGNAYAIVTGTGMQTEIGRISEMLDQKKSATPLEQQLDRLGKTLILISAIVAVVVTIVGIITGEPIYDMIKIGIILAIASVPEALPAVSTITLALGMRTMAKHHALVKNLPAVETLGSTTVICTDKTGTLTENQMTVTHVHLISGDQFTVEGNGYEPKGAFLQSGEEIDIEGRQKLQELLLAGVLSSNASLIEEENDYAVIGDPTEGALVVLGRKGDLDRQNLEGNGYTRIGEIPFDSRAKYMATAYTHEEESTLYIKGAPDVLFENSGLSESELSVLQEANDSLTNQGMRVLAIGKIASYKGDGDEQDMKDALKKGFSLLGVVGIIDPPRSDVKQAVKEAREAGIRVIMITGDHPRTARIIAEQIGMDADTEAITGKEMDTMSDQELAKRIRSTSVFARVSPENKLQIVRALNEEHEVTAMTGDGVNDAPALNGADIGVAMGIRGTEVAKEASDMILTDDRFSTIVDAVREGRIIFDNIEKFIYFLFSCNFIEILVVFVALVIGVPVPIVALQILWLNLVVDVLPAMSLAWEPGEPGVMKRKPRDPKTGIVTRSFLLRVLSNGALIGAGALSVFLFALSADLGETTARTLAFTTMAIGQLAHIFNVREKESFGLDRGIIGNPLLIGALIISVGLQLVAVYVPFFNRVLDTTPITLRQWGWVLLGAILPMILIQSWRAVARKRTAGRQPA